MAREGIVEVDSLHSACRNMQGPTARSLSPAGCLRNVRWRPWAAVCLLLWLATPAGAGWLGVELRDGVPDAAGGRAGLVVGTVIRGSPAAEAGLQPGDRLLAIQGRPTQGAQESAETIRALAPGTPVQLVVLHAGRPRTVTVTLGDPPTASPPLPPIRRRQARRK